MAKNTSGKTEFLELRLSEGDKRAMRSNEVFQDRWVESLDNLLQDGFKLTVKQDVARGNVTLCIMDAAAPFGSPIDIITVRGPTVGGCLMRVAYYYNVIADRNQEVFLRSLKDGFADD